MDSIANIHIYNNFRLITEFNKKLITVRDLTIDEISLSQKTI